jgi:hypothetical protein
MYRFRLRTLLAGVTLFAFLLAIRLEYIRRQIAFHRGEAAAAQEALAKLEHQPIAAGLDDWRKAIHHDQVANAYERALVRPWTWVDETTSSVTLPGAPTKPPAATP